MFGILLVITTTFEFAGAIPPTGNGRIIPPAVIVALAAAIKAAFVQLKLLKAAAVGQVIEALLKFNGEPPT
jgi:hypothetical protein